MLSPDQAESLYEEMQALCPGLSVEFVAECDSSNTRLLERARDAHKVERTQSALNDLGSPGAHKLGDVSPCLLVTARQSAGRGRMGRAWSGAAGDTLMFSLGLPLAPADWSGLSLVAGTALAEALHPELQIKWPNDLWWQLRKLSGILVETTAMPAGFHGNGRQQAMDLSPDLHRPPHGPQYGPQNGPQHSLTRYTVIGVGINVRAPQTSDLSTAPAWVQEWWPQADTGAVLSRVAPALLRAVLDFERQGLAPWLPRFAKRDVLRDREVQLSNGLQGRALGVGPDGGLLLQTTQGLQTLRSAAFGIRPLWPEHSDDNRANPPPC